MFGNSKFPYILLGTSRISRKFENSIVEENTKFSNSNFLRFPYLQDVKKVEIEIVKNV